MGEPCFVNDVSKGQGGISGPVRVSPRWALPLSVARALGEVTPGWQLVELAFLEGVAASDGLADTSVHLGPARARTCLSVGDGCLA